VLSRPAHLHRALAFVDVSVHLVLEDIGDTPYYLIEGILRKCNGKDCTHAASVLMQELRSLFTNYALSVDTS